MERYKPIIDDWEAFQEACQKPLVSTVRKTVSKLQTTSKNALEKALRM